MELWNLHQEFKIDSISWTKIAQGTRTPKHAHFELSNELK